MKRALHLGALLFFLGLALAVGADVESARVRHVVDGDSLVLDDGRAVRLIGVNTPELGGTNGPDQPLARAARSLLTDLVEGQGATVETGEESLDHYGRTLAYVFLPDGRSVEEILTRRGLAWVVAIPPNVKGLARLLAAEREARRHRRGVWGIAEYRPAAAGTLGTNDTGFRLVKGTIRQVSRSRRAYYFELAPGFTLLIPRSDWRKWFTGRPKALLGRRVVTRGWVTERHGALRMRVRHPAMLTFIETG